MDLIADRGRRVTIEELNTTRLLAHARKQAHQRNFDDMIIVDVDAHHYENENYDEFLPYMENDVLRQLTMSGRKRNRAGITPTQVGYQDMGGRVTPYPLRTSERAENHTAAELHVALGTSLVLGPLGAAQRVARHAAAHVLVANLGRR